MPLSKTIVVTVSCHWLSNQEGKKLLIIYVNAKFRYQLTSIGVVVEAKRLKKQDHFVTKMS